MGKLKKCNNNHIILKSFRQLISICVLVAFSFSIIFQTSNVFAQTSFNLPASGTMVVQSSSFAPVTVKGITLNPHNPLNFNFIIDTGDTDLNDNEFKVESEKLIKYFLTSLTIPEEDLWVNLSPYESDRIIPEVFGFTEMGRDLLAQDYMLKQLTSSLMYPEGELGQKFWERVYERAFEEYGVTNVPIDTFNKVWILPESADIYEHDNGAVVLGSKLKVMLDTDYIAMKKNLENKIQDGASQKQDNISKQLIREIILPEIEKEVNEGETFAQLRQIYNSLILATWFKLALKESLLGSQYVDQNKTEGIKLDDNTVNKEIYDQYVESFKVGAYDYIKEEYDPIKQQTFPKKYFSGGYKSEGVLLAVKKGRVSKSVDAAALAEKLKPEGIFKDVEVDLSSSNDNAMLIANVEWENSNGKVFTEDEQLRVKTNVEILRLIRNELIRNTIFRNIFGYEMKFDDIKRVTPKYVDTSKESHVFRIEILLRNDEVLNIAFKIIKKGEEKVRTYLKRSTVLLWTGFVPKFGAPMGTALMEEWIEGDTVFKAIGDGVLPEYHLENITETWIRAGWNLSSSSKFEGLFSDLNPSNIMYSFADSSIPQFRVVGLSGKIGASPAETIEALKKYYVDGKEEVSVKSSEKSQNLGPILRGVKRALIDLISRKFLFTVLLNPTEGLLEGDTLAHIEKFIIENYSLKGKPSSYIEAYVLKHFLKTEQKISPVLLRKVVLSPNIMNIKSLRVLLDFFRNYKGKTISDVRSEWKVFSQSDHRVDKNQEELDLIFDIVLGEEVDPFDIQVVESFMKSWARSSDESLKKVEKGEGAEPGATDTAALSMNFQKGGIDLNPEELKINKDGKGNLKVFKQIPKYFRNININKLVPEIIKVTPVNLPLLSIINKPIAN